jgi:hypothetical protein
MQALILYNKFNLQAAGEPGQAEPRKRLIAPDLIHIKFTCERLPYGVPSQGLRPTPDDDR